MSLMKPTTPIHRATGTTAVWGLLLGLIFCSPHQPMAQPIGVEQEEDKPRWYQVEIVIFERNNHSVENSELWPRDIALAYPPNWVELKSPDTYDANGASISNGLEEDYGSETVFSDGNIYSVYPVDTEVQPAVDEPTEPPSAPAPQSPVPDASEQDFPQEEQEAPKPVDLEREPYFLLPEEHQQLQAEVNSLKRDKRYRLLTHKTWRQPVTDLDKSPAVLIEGGGNYGAHHELEGSITLSVSRYLHLKTNLWLSDFIANYGQEHKDWPELPARPTERSDSASALLLDNSQAGLWSEFQAGEEEYENILSKPYLVNGIVTLTQKRRMRSGELHYLDHPRIGLLVKVTPYELPEDEVLEEDELEQEKTEEGQAPFEQTTAKGQET